MTVRIYDKSFARQLCVNTVGQMPKHFSWRHEGDPGRVAWFTDSCLENALRTDAEIKVGWVLELPSLRTDPYDFIDSHQGLFTYTVAWDEYWRTENPNHTVCLALGSRLYPSDRQLYSKSKRVSIIASPRRERSGYDLRHTLIETEGGNLDAYGQTYYRMPDDYKLMALAPYMFTVVIPRVKGVTTEAIYDAFLTGTIPIMWGKAIYDGTFDIAGCIQCETLAELQDAVRNVGIDDYKSRLQHVETNFNLAQSLSCPEDWLFDLHPHLFGM